MNNEKINKLGEGPSNKEKLLKPLREVGTINKTQYWTFDDIEDPIKEANLLNINPEQLYKSQDPMQNAHNFFQTNYKLSKFVIIRDNSIVS